MGVMRGCVSEGRARDVGVMREKSDEMTNIPHCG